LESSCFIDTLGSSSGDAKERALIWRFWWFFWFWWFW
jgi:hypothetical protein